MDGDDADDDPIPTTTRSGSLAEVVRERRIAMRLTQRQAARRAGVSLATWQGVERTTSSPERFTELTLSRVASGLRLPPATLFEAAGRPAPTVGEEPAPSPDRRDHDAEATIEEVAGRLRAVAERSETDLLLIADVVRELSDRLMRDSPG